MTIRLLQRDNEAVQNEIREYQRRYIENRSRYMDEVMHFHQQDMARTPFSRPSSGKLSSVDQRFLQQHSKVCGTGCVANNNYCHWSLLYHAVFCSRVDLPHFMGACRVILVFPKPMKL